MYIEYENMFPPQFRYKPSLKMWLITHLTTSNENTKKYYIYSVNYFYMYLFIAT